MRQFKFFMVDDEINQYQADMAIYEEGWQAADNDSNVTPYLFGSRECSLWIEGYQDRLDLREHRRRTNEQ